jgi:hypothetical protein
MSWKSCKPSEWSEQDELNKQQNEPQNLNNSFAPSFDKDELMEKIARERALTTIELGNSSIYWTKNDIHRMHMAQKKLNEYIIAHDFVISNEIKEGFKRLQNDISEYVTSVCNVCGDKQSQDTHMNIEHMKFKVSWGYGSGHDTQTHSLTLCVGCYDDYILNSHLGKYVKVTNYM